MLSFVRMASNESESGRRREKWKREPGENESGNYFINRNGEEKEKARSIGRSVEPSIVVVELTHALQSNLYTTYDLLRPSLPTRSIAAVAEQNVLTHSIRVT